MEFTFTLTRPAKSSGGDRYEHEQKGHEMHMVFYIPQVISRPNGIPLHKLTITIER